MESGEEGILEFGNWIIEQLDNGPIGQWGNGGDVEEIFFAETV
jgi:hypothetical protein